jgi:hypothetical protein
VNATSDTRSGAGRSGAITIDSRVDRGRFSQRLTGPSASLPNERRNATLADLASPGSLHILPPAASGQGDRPQGPCLGQAGHGTGQAGIAFGGRLALAVVTPREGAGTRRSRWPATAWTR